MAYWQHEYVRKAAVMPLNGQYVLELPKAGQLGSLFVAVSGTEVAGLGATGGAWRIIDYISKVEIIADGATVIKSLTGYEAQALAFYDQGVLPEGTWRNYAANTQFENILINFGRWYKDAVFGLDLSRFKIVELKITNTAAAASHFTDLTVDVLGCYLRDVVGAFAGVLRSEEWRAWTTVQNETKYNSLPVDYPIRRVMLQAIPPVDASNIEKTNMANLMYDIELNLDTAQVRVWKGGIKDLMRLNHLDIGKPILSSGWPYHNADVGIDMSLGYIYGLGTTTGSQSGTVATTFATMESARTSFTQKAEVHNADNPTGLLALGLAPFLTALFDFDVNYDPASWLDPRARYEVQLNIQTRDAASAVGGRNAIVLDRLVR